MKESIRHITRAVLPALAVLAILALPGTPATFAQEGDVAPEGSGAAEPLDREELERVARERFDELHQRLNLTEEQESQLRPILLESVTRIALIRQEMRGKSKGPRSDFVAKREEMGKIQRETDARLETILDPEQINEYHKVRAEWRDRIRRMAREQRGRPEGE